MARTPVTIRLPNDRSVDVPAYRQGAFAIHHGIDSEGNPIPLNGWTITHVATGLAVIPGIMSDRDQVANVARGLDAIVRAFGDHDSKTAFMASPTASAIKAYLRRTHKDVSRLWRPKAAAGRRTRSWIIEQAHDAIEEVSA